MTCLLRQRLNILSNQFRLRCRHIISSFLNATSVILLTCTSRMLDYGIRLNDVMTRLIVLLTILTRRRRRTVRMSRQNTLLLYHILPMIR